MDFTARQIADVLNGKVEGDPEVAVSRLAKIEEGLPGTMTFPCEPALHPAYLYHKGLHHHSK